LEGLDRIIFVTSLRVLCCSFLLMDANHFVKRTFPCLEMSNINSIAMVGGHWVELNYSMLLLLEMLSSVL
jgi:hypothetical protein